VDLSAERELSRQLVRETRELRDHLDPQAAQLVGDMEKILIEIASRNETTDRDHFDLIRSGIRQQNLLFKVRMTESVYQLQAASHEPLR
jgi:RNA processing factor Prp31